MKGFVAALILGFVCTSRSDTLISGFSPSEHPFEYSGMFGSLIQNPDGTQTVLQPEDKHAFWAIFLQPTALDATDGGKNLAISLRAKRELDNTAVEHFDLMVYSANAMNSQVVALVRYDDFPVGSFGTVTIPFESFSFVGFDTNSNRPLPLELFQSIDQILIYDFNVNTLNRTHFTFDSLSAVQIPEPSPCLLIGFGLLAMTFSAKLFPR